MNIVNLRLKKKIHLPWKSTLNNVHNVLSKEEHESTKAKNIEEQNIEEQVALAQTPLTKEEIADEIIAQALQSIQKTPAEIEERFGPTSFDTFSEDLFA